MTGLSIVGRNNKPVDGIQPTCSMNGILSTPDCINHGSLISPKSHNLKLKWHPPQLNMFVNPGLTLCTNVKIHNSLQTTQT